MMTNPNFEADREFLSFTEAKRRLAVWDDGDGDDEESWSPDPPRNAGTYRGQVAMG